ncbi:MAG: DUF2442 domain-containing protein [Pirellulaceae bacterium]
MNPRVESVVPTDDYRLKLKFTNGEVGTFDCSHLLDFGVFREFQNIAYFLRATVVDGTVAWPHEQDICPDTLYEDSIRDDPKNAEPTVPVEPRNGPCSDGESTHAAH